MLKSWSIKNFKPIVDSGELQLAPVTVLAGRNSSGKSSLLQSILMIAQTLGSRLLDRPLITNGLLTQLGTFNDIINMNSRERTLEIAFYLIFNDDEHEELDPLFLDHENSILKEISLSLQLKNHNETDAISSAIEASKIDIANINLVMHILTMNPNMDESLEDEVEMSIEPFSNADFEEFIRSISTEYRHSLSEFKQENNRYLCRFESYLMEKELLVGLSHFLPSHALEKFDIELQTRLSFIGDLFRPARYFPESNSRPPNYLLKHNIPDGLKQSIADICQYRGGKEFSGQTFADLKEWYQTYREEIGRHTEIELMRTIGDYLGDHPLVFESHQGNPDGLYNFIFPFLGLSLKEASEKTSKFFASRIRYLGPLRADPQASQKFSPSSELDDVGTKGEYAAAVYDANQFAKIEWLNPLSQQIEQGTLEEALDVWMRHLGIADHVQIETASQSGFSWQVAQRKGQKPLPLSYVGVGISQILPILVMGLLSPTNSLLIIEQPELHLHPYVQARLGDFFMGLAKCKKQCLIETHSENLVSQLRLHIVEAGGLEKSDCTVYFVDQDEKGAAQFKQIEISPNGNIMNWPDGFFDETMLQEDRITAASLRKRAKKAQQA